MADNIAVTAGSGTIVSTEEVTTLNGGAVSAQHLQRIANAFVTADGAARDADLGAGNIGSATQRVAIATNDAAIAALQAAVEGTGVTPGTAGTPSADVMTVQGAAAGTALPARTSVDIFTVTLSTDTSAYADGDVLADTQSVSSVFLTSGGGRTLMSVHVLDKADQGQGFDLIFLDANNSLGTENSAPNISDANAEAILGRVAISSSDFYDIGGCRIATRTGINLPMEGNASTTLYVGAISRGTGTYGASDLIIKLGFQ